MSEHYDVVIIGGSFAGLSAGLMLGRMMQKVLIVDEGKRCNARVTESHNFLSRDGADPAKVIQEAKEQLSRYASVTLREHASVSDVAIIGEKQFQVEVSNGVVYARRVVFATGLKDMIPDIPGFAECWAISIFNCPFCHGFESKDGIVGMIDNGPMTFLFCSLQKAMSKDLTLLTNGPVAFSSDQKDILINKGVLIIEDEISAIEHVEGQIECVTFRNGNKIPFTALFVHVKTEQSCKIPEELGLEIGGPLNTIKVNEQFQTAIPGIYAAGDCEAKIRQVSLSSTSGSICGAFIAMELSVEAMMTP